MNKVKIILILISLQGSVLSGCHKELPKPKEYPTNLEVRWNALFHSNGKGDYFRNYEIAKDQYIVLANRSQTIGIYNKQTGERHSAWQNNLIVSEIIRLNSCKVVGENKDIILVYDSKSLFAYSLHTAQRLWNLNIPNSGCPYMSADKDYAFISYGLSKSWYRLAMVDVYSGTQRDILQLHAEDNYNIRINPPSSYITSDGDTLLFFTTSGWNFDAVHGRVHTYCHNLTKKQIVWENKQFTTDTDATAAQPPPFVIENNKLVVTSMRAIHCFNMHTGELIWQREGLSFPDMPPLYHEERLYIRYGNPAFLICLDAQTGQQIWENTTSNPTPAFDGKMDIYKDRLFVSVSNQNATYSLLCVDTHTGKELWRDLGPYGNIAFGVLVDKKTGYLYCNTDWSTLCVDLNKTPNGKNR
ncbi:MAG: PQQ-binding-like beta-propeller repeat protein [Bacteroidales bacterium]|nr:PQQ-binding-like beta-propeller repeat protein [Bacteroidales bacterium]